ncbi:MAG TPA: VOC family protein [Thermoplasmata archaeon]|nr:VOC family protein [Thermoplasmata archaeon]HUJ77901.1 VOC family protein [Thermoplasmata archaeon]
MGLRYVGLRVTDLDRSLAFYTELLGLRETRRGRTARDGRWIVLEDPRSHQRIELNWYPPGSPFRTRYRPGEGLDHLGFRVSDPEATFRRVVAAGAVPALAPDDPDGVPGVWYVKDPDGNWIEFY